MSCFRVLKFLSVLALCTGTPAAAWAQQTQVIDFESFNIGASDGFSGPADNAVIAPGTWGNDYVGTIDVGGVHFSNRLSVEYGSWSGFSIAKGTDSQTAGYTNEFSSITGGGANGSSQYAIAFGYHNTEANAISDAFNPANAVHLRGLPSIYLPQNNYAVSFDVTNTTYAALSMLHGDGFAKSFGGTSGNDPDYFDLNIYGIDEHGNALSNFITVSLADYTFQDNSLDFLLDEWQTIDLRGLSDASSLHFNLASSDAGMYGMNTPAYFAMDNLTVAAVPEPASIALCGFVTLAAAVGHRVRRKRICLRDANASNGFELQV